MKELDGDDCHDMLSYVIIVSPVFLNHVISLLNPIDVNTTTI